MFINRNFVFINNSKRFSVSDIKLITIIENNTIQIVIHTKNNQQVTINNLTKIHVERFLMDLNQSIKDIDHLPNTYISEKLLATLISDKQEKKTITDKWIDQPAYNDYDINDSDLSFTQWRIQKMTNKKYILVNSDHKTEYYIITIKNEKMQCSCRKDKCQHTKYLKQYI